MSNVSPHFYAVILAGGGGTRLWPKSRKKHPKHLLNLLGKESMLQLTFKRISNIFPVDKIFLITLGDYASDVISQLPLLKKENLILEPVQKNTALAMGVAAAYVKNRDEKGTILNVAADQLIEDDKEFQNAVLLALETAKESDDIVAIGIRPTFPHTGLGYIRIGEQVDHGLVFKCRGFKEKPNITTAQSFLASGQYLWNANLYCWKVETIFQAMKAHSPKIYHAMEEIFQTIGKQDEPKVKENVYKEAENVQIDYAVSEKAKNLLVVPGDFGWSDIGDWKVVYDSNFKDKTGNVVVAPQGEFIGIDNKNCFFETKDKLVVGIGLENIVVVATNDAILICAKERTQDVKKAVEEIKLSKKDTYL